MGMEILADGRTRRTRTEWVKIIDRFNSTRLPTIEFCEREAISRSSLAIWRRKLKSKRKHRARSTKRPAFIELTPARTGSSDSPVNSESEFELTFPGGVTLRWKG
jgi:hypothetical protein